MSKASIDPKNQEAIEAALAQNWQKALSLNNDLVKEYPDDIDTLNRLARAYLELGELSKAKANYNKVIQIDPYNSIAAKNLIRLSSIRKKDVKAAATTASEVKADVDPDLFLEEPGKTKVLGVVDLAMPAVLASLKTGDSLRFETQKNQVVVSSAENKRIGKIESDWGKTLARAIKAGSQFVSVVKSVSIAKEQGATKLSIFVKEISRSPKVPESIFPSNPSFFTPYVREDTFNDASENHGLDDETENTQSEENEADSDDGNKSHLTSSLETLAEKEIEDENLYDDD